MHYAYGAPAAAATANGFNLVDLQYASSVNALPDGSKALIYLDEGNGVTQSFIDKVTPLLNNPKVFGFYLTDEPDPTGRYHTKVTAANLKAESDWIHSHFPGAKTFITLMEMGSYTNSDYSNTYNPANTGIDYYGINPYPVRTTAVDFNYIDRAVAAALKAGIPLDAIVPVYQSFGGGGWATNTGGSYVMPTTAQMQTMLDHWEKLVPSPAFDMVYKWSSQNGETSLGNTSSMQAFFKEHNAHTDTGTSTPPTTTVPPTDSSNPTTDPSHPTTDPSHPTTDPSHPTTDAVVGTSGNDTLKADGAHAMIGYAGNDDYYVDHVGDTVIEAAGQGQDRVWTSVSYALSAGQSIEVLGTTNDSGTTAINLTGNELAQTIIGNDGNNVINGGGGADNMIGHAGNDDYYVDNAGDRVTEIAGQGQDRIWTSVSYALSSGQSIEVLGTTNDSGTTAINLTGNELAQTIQGNASANVINGGGGADKLTGFGGKDVFVFNSALGAGNVDRITDFDPSQDKIHLDDSVFKGLKAGALAGDAFYAGTAAHDSSDHIIYNSTTGALYFDSDGTGSAAQIQFAALSPHLAVTASSFAVI
jgi:Ca2+-binding RTX toxin-like protein